MKLLHSLWSHMASYHNQSVRQKHTLDQAYYPERLRRSSHPSALQNELPEIQAAFRQYLTGGNHV